MIYISVGLSIYQICDTYVFVTFVCSVTIGVPVGAMFSSSNNRMGYQNTGATNGGYMSNQMTGVNTNPFQRGQQGAGGQGQNGQGDTPFFTI